MGDWYRLPHPCLPVLLEGKRGQHSTGVCYAARANAVFPTVSEHLEFKCMYVYMYVCIYVCMYIYICMYICNIHDVCLLNMKLFLMKSKPCV